MKVLITGSSGYLGYVLSKFFSEKKIEVVGVDINRNSVWESNSNFTFYRADVTDKARLAEIFTKEQPTQLIHLAYLMNPLHDLKKEHQIDVVGSQNVLEVANEINSIKQLILFSSASAYGGWVDNKLWIKEDQPLRPRDYRYAINKKKVEENYNQFTKRKDLNLVTLRMCTAIGPLYHKPGGVVSLLVKAPCITKIKNRYCELQFLHEADLTALLDLIVNDAEITGTYNLAPDSYATTKELAVDKLFVPVPLSLMRGVVGLLWSLRLASIRPAAITLSTYGIVVDPQKLKERYNYQFKYTTLSGFKDTVEKRRIKGSL